MPQRMLSRNSWGKRHETDITPDLGTHRRQLSGTENIVLESVASLKNAAASDLSYAEPKFQANALQSNAGCILVSAVPVEASANRSFIVVRNPKLALPRPRLSCLETAIRHSIHPRL
jgi:UDP-3-O-[3-hydroxymyristoyl] glucosamine N-acyltransferase